MIDSVTIALAMVALGIAAGILGGLLGVGGGVLFVPGLVIFLGLSQHQAEATSLMAIVPVALVGAAAQDRHGNVRRADALRIGLFSLLGVAGGVALANVLSGAALRTAFALLMLLIAAQIARRALGRQGQQPTSGAGHDVNKRNDPIAPEKA
jgi:uncharacterized protein